MTCGVFTFIKFDFNWINFLHTVKVKGMKRTFPYNAVGKAQADSFAKMMKGKISYNPGYGMEKKTKSGY